MPSQEADASVEEGGAEDILLKPIGDSVTVTSANSDGEVTPMVGDESPPVLETEEERKARRRSHYVVYFTTFIGAVGFSIVITGVWPYLQKLDPGVSKEFLGWVIAANPLGQVITSPLLGLWSNKAGSNRGPLLLAMCIFVLGNAMYAILSVFGDSARAFMVFARFLVGVSFANMAIIRAYVAASTTTQERTSAVAFTSAAQGGGFIVGPALQAAIAVAFSKEKEEAFNSTLAKTLEYQFEDDIPHVEWNMYTAAGWSAMVLGIINFFLFLPCVFQEHHIAAKEAQLLKNAANESDAKLPKPDYKTIVNLLLAFFVVQFVFVLLEVLLVPMCIDMYAWSDEAALTIIGIGMCIAGIIATITFGMVGVLVKRFDERKVYIFLGLIPLLISMVCFFPMGSTYPKMQNCTSDSAANHRDTRSIPTLFPYYLEVSRSQIYSLNNAKKMRKSSFELPNAPVSNELDTEDLFDPINETYSSHNTLSRRRRRIRREKKCLDLGCPQEQEWCKYTPIIEYSQMVVGCFLAFVGYAISFSLSSSLYSKLLGPKPQGVWMGILTSIGSFSRMTGPVFVSYLYTALGTRWTFGFLIVAMIFTTVLMLAFFKRLVPMKITRG